MCVLFYRIILAAIHFNYNVNRGTKKRTDGTERIKVDYPKFKNGEATVRGVRIAPNFGKYNGTIQILFCYDSVMIPFHENMASVG